MLQDCNFPRFSQKVCQQLRTRWKEFEEGIDLRYNICILFTFQYISALFLSFYSGLLISLCICIIFIQFTTVHAIRVSDQFLNFYDNTKAYMRARGIYGAVRGLFWKIYSVFGKVLSHFSMHENTNIDHSLVLDCSSDETVNQTNHYSPHANIFLIQ